MNKHIGSNFNEFLAEDGTLAESEKQEPVAKEKNGGG